MKHILLLLLLILMVFNFGCKKEVSEDLEPITGEVLKIEEIVAEEEIEEEVIEDVRENVTTIRLCHDTDNGMVRWVSGSVFGFYNNATRFEFKDYCQNFNYLMEFYCEDENPKQQIFLCRNGCEEGHCK